MNSLFRLRPAARLAITIGIVALSLVYLSLSLRMVPYPEAATMKGRVQIARNIAVSITTMAESGSVNDMKRFIERTVLLEPDIVSLGLRRNQDLLFDQGNHAEKWSQRGSDGENRWFEVEILSKGNKWGQLEVVFASQMKQGMAGWLDFPTGLVAFFFASMTLSTWWVLGRTFRYLNPSKVVPDRVRNALDSISSGLVMTTPKGEIAHVNQAFSKMLGRPAHEIITTNLDSLEWIMSHDLGGDLPWKKSKKINAAVNSVVLEARFRPGVSQKYMVNSTPLWGKSDEIRGMLVSFEDVTVLETKKVELAQTIQKVRQSRDEVERQNEKLFFLANYDPLTQCLNRRSLYTEYEKLWSESSHQSLVIMIMDIDYFKRVNDDHGHSAGDAVLKEFGSILRTVVGKKGSVFRYGGEEFTVLLGGMEFEACCDLAEELRAAIAQQPIAKLNITTSVGLSQRSFGAMDPQHMLDQADECLYAAKRNGRNQVVRFDQIQQYSQQETEGANPPRPEQSTDQLLADNSFTAVSGLLSALSYRCKKTAEHSVRVADLAIEIGGKLLSKRELCHLEIAALMHDIGKIGVPDSILNKKEKLTPDEWKIMRKQQEIGAAILQSALGNDEIVKIIQNYRTSKQKVEQSRSLSCKILEVCNAFDAMVSDQVYRAKMPVDQALAEIIRNTPQQFDPQVVEKLIEYVTSELYQIPQATETPGTVDDAIAAGADGRECSTISPNPSHQEEIDKLANLASEVLGMCELTNVSARSAEPTKLGRIK